MRHRKWYFPQWYESFGQAVGVDRINLDEISGASKKAGRTSSKLNRCLHIFFNDGIANFFKEHLITYETAGEIL